MTRGYQFPDKSNGDKSSHDMRPPLRERSAEEVEQPQQQVHPSPCENFTPALSSTDNCHPSREDPFIGSVDANSPYHSLRPTRRMESAYLRYRPLLTAIWQAPESRSKVIRMSYGNCLGTIHKFTFALLIIASRISFSPTTISAQTLAEHLGYPPGTKLIMVHADDLGETHAVNAAAIKSLEAGSVNSASLMVPCPWFPEIADYAKSHPSGDFGLHLTLRVSEFIIGGFGCSR